MMTATCFIQWELNDDDSMAAMLNVVKRATSFPWLHLVTKRPGDYKCAMPKPRFLVSPPLLIAFLFALTLPGEAAAAETNVPPPSVIFVRGGATSWLDFPNVFIARRAQKSATVGFDFGSDIDDEGEQLYFQWFLDETLASQAARFTNEFEQGLHTVHASVTDNRDIVSADSTVEVITPMDAIRRLRADVELSGVRERLNHLRPPLRYAEKAIQHRRWSSASRQLTVFGRRLARHLDPDTEEDLTLYNRWHDAAEELWGAVRHLPRNPNATPRGVFPGP